jgi:hypothetical protein
MRGGRRRLRRRGRRGQAAQGGTDDGGVGGRPEGRQRCSEEIAVAGGHQPGIEHGDHPAVGHGPEQPPGPLGQEQRGLGRGDRHEPVAAAGRHRALTGRGQRVVGPGERDPVDHDQLQRAAGHVHALPQRQRAEQASRLVIGELPDQLGRDVVALAEQRMGDPAAERPGRLFRGPHGGEQPERTAAGRVDQLLEFGQVRLGQLVPARRRQVPGDVQDAAARVIERRPDVKSGPR